MGSFHRHSCMWGLDWLQSLKQFFINVSYHLLVASLTLMALFQNRAIRVRLATNIWYDTLMKNCFKDWSQLCEDILIEHKWAIHRHSMPGSRGGTEDLGPPPPPHPEKSQSYRASYQYWSGSPENLQSYQARAFNGHDLGQRRGTGVSGHPGKSQLLHRFPGIPAPPGKMSEFLSLNWAWQKFQDMPDIKIATCE